MLFNKDLENIIFTRNQLFACDELVIISGYVGPTPIAKLGELPVKSTVIYGMYGSDGIQERLHAELLKCNNQLKDTNILYAQIPVHAKCYIWREKGRVVHSLIGSANFSVNGLQTPYKEVLAETTVDTFQPLNDYLKLVMDNSIDCTGGVVRKSSKTKIASLPEKIVDLGIAAMPLFTIERGEKIVPSKSGLNWCFANAHVSKNDAYIAIRKAWVALHPSLFPKKQTNPLDTSTGRAQRHNDRIEIIWDDGTTMTGLLEGTQNGVDENGEIVSYPKQICSHPTKSTMGEYFRKRMDISEYRPIMYADLMNYGRDTVDISLQGEGIYYFDFSVPTP